MNITADEIIKLSKKSEELGEIKERMKHLTHNVEVIRNIEYIRAGFKASHGECSITRLIDEIIELVNSQP